MSGLLPQGAWEPGRFEPQTHYKHPVDDPIWGLEDGMYIPQSDEVVDYDDESPHRP